MKKSISSSVWIEKNHDEILLQKILARHNVSLVLAKLIALVPNLEFADIGHFLNPKIKHLMPDPNHLMDMQKAVERIVSAIRNNEKITVFGDYDVDGATSSAIIFNYLREIGIHADVYIPDRILEGYGPNVEAMEKIAQKGTKLLITVDCGTVAFQPLEHIHNLGVDAIVIDHHLGVKDVPKSVAVINPNRFGETTNLKYLCGAGVSFMMIVALNARLRHDGFFKNGVPEPNIIELLPLVALGTICDIMKLEGLNRAFVATGLQMMQKPVNLGLKALMEVAAVEKVDEYTLGFVMGPCINAGGRIGNAKLGVELLTERDYQKALKIAVELYGLNIERREIENKMKEDAIAKLDSVDFSSEPVILIGSKDYHQGVIGILAARLKDKYNRPAIVYSESDSCIKASARSVFGVDIGSFINGAVKSGILLAGGGHEMAGGFSCEISKIEDLKAEISRLLAEKVERLTAVKVTEYSCEITLGDITSDFYSELQKLRPFGPGNNKPLFAIRGLEISFWKKRGEKHLFLVLIDEWGRAIRAMFFGFFENFGEEKMTDLSSGKIDILCQVTLNDWNGGNSLELHITDIIM